MKVEKIADNKVMITMSFEELARRHVTFNDIASNNTTARNFYLDLIEESNIDDCFEAGDSKLLLEASANTNNTFTLLVTRVEDIPTSRNCIKIRPSLLYNRLDCQLFEFPSLNRILDFCDKTKDENLYLGTNSLYKYEDRYFILFADSSIKNKKFLKTYAMLTEYSSRYFSYDLFYTAIKEKSDIVIQNRALQKLRKI